MAGVYDFARRRAAKRSGRERGCWAYIPAEVLQAVGFKPGDDPPFYRLWHDPKRPRIIVNLYREP